MAYSRDSSGSGWCRRKKFRRHWSHVRMPCIFIGCFIDQAQLDSHDGRTQWGIFPREAKNIEHVWFFPHGLARPISHQKFPAHGEKTAEQTASRGSLLSSFLTVCGGLELQHSSLWRITNKREARNIGFWADVLIIFKFPHNFFSSQV